MLTYTLEGLPGEKLYSKLYGFLKDDIQSGALAAGTRLPSKRQFAENLGVSVITVENAYAQLISEGYIYALPKRGYFVAKGQRDVKPAAPARQAAQAAHAETPAAPLFDLAGNRTDPANFPFSTWAKLMRAVLSEQRADLMANAPVGGVEVLRQALADHLLAFRGMRVDPANIVVGAGTEFLYGLLVQLFGTETVWAVEDPGYRKLSRIYGSHGASCRFLPVDGEGLSAKALEESGADVVHLSPAHHFPTGVTMSAARRLALLRWAAGAPERFIVEDDYDSEFRLSGRPAPPLTSLDDGGKVIYMNTFTKSLASTVRISYMVLPGALMRRFLERLGFYACTVPNLEQYTLARFIDEGFFEKHLNRMRLRYRKKRDALLDALLAEQELGLSVENIHSGLHFLLRVPKTPEAQLAACAASRGVRIVPLSAYYRTPPASAGPDAVFPVSYAGLRDGDVPEAARRLLEAVRESRGN